MTVLHHLGEMTKPCYISTPNLYHKGLVWTEKLRIALVIESTEHVWGGGGAKIETTATAVDGLILLDRHMALK